MSTTSENAQQYLLTIENLTKDYGKGRGIFDVNIKVKEGTVYGFLGPNGAGKTTAIRHLLGFSNPQKGCTTIKGLNCWSNSAKIQKYLGYVPGEIFFPDNFTGMKFINLIANMRNMKNKARIDELCEYFNINPHGRLKRMSKGMKQKIALILAFMHEPEILILDEPTSGLDPLMQDLFVKLVKKEKANGKTIFMSSHMFNEIEKTCDVVGIIKEGKMITEIDLNDIFHKKDKLFEIRFKELSQMKKFVTNKNFNYEEIIEAKNRIKININDRDIDGLISELSKFKLEYITEIKYTLEDHFMNFYNKEANNFEHTSI